MNVRIAVPVYFERISPLFDTAGRFEIFETNRSEVLKSYSINTCKDSGISKIDKLKAGEVDLIICAAISKIFAEYISSKRIELIPGVCGNVDEVIGAYMDDSLETDLFLMPGCRWMNRYRGKKCPRYREIQNREGKWRIR